MPIQSCDIIAGIVPERCKTWPFTSILGNLANVSPPRPVQFNVVNIRLQKQILTARRPDFIAYIYLCAIPPVPRSTLAAPVLGYPRFSNKMIRSVLKSKRQGQSE
jgi:hypothetical protein